MRIRMLWFPVLLTFASVLSAQEEGANRGCNNELYRDTIPGFVNPDTTSQVVAWPPSSYTLPEGRVEGDWYVGKYPNPNPSKNDSLTIYIPRRATCQARGFALGTKRKPGDAEQGWVGVLSAVGDVMSPSKAEAKTMPPNRPARLIAEAEPPRQAPTRTKAQIADSVRKAKAKVDSAAKKAATKSAQTNQPAVTTRVVGVVGPTRYDTVTKVDTIVKMETANADSAADAAAKATALHYDSVLTNAKRVRDREIAALAADKKKLQDSLSKVLPIASSQVEVPPQGTSKQDTTKKDTSKAKPRSQQRIPMQKDQPATRPAGTKPQVVARVDTVKVTKVDTVQLAGKTRFDTVTLTKTVTLVDTVFVPENWWDRNKTKVFITTALASAAGGAAAYYLHRPQDITNVACNGYTEEQCRRLVNLNRIVPHAGFRIPGLPVNLSIVVTPRSKKSPSLRK